MLKSLIIVCSTFAVTSVFGQILTWTNSNAIALPGGNYGRSTNWSGDNGSGTVPPATTPISGTIGTFDGTVAPNLFVFSQDGINGAGSGNPIGGGFGASGITLHLTAGQSGSLLFYSPVASSAGMGFNGIQVDAGAGQLILGNNTVNQIVATLRPSSSLHTWINNSTHPVIINPNFQIQNGGGAAGHIINFQGTGDWAITNALRFNNNAPSEDIQWDSTGTTIWAASAAPTNLFNSLPGNMIINAGTIIVKSAGLLPVTPGANTLQLIGGQLILDQAGQSDTIGRTISGTAPLRVNAGTNTFTSGNSTFTSPIDLAGGELIAGAGENVGVSGPLGQGGIISFNGGMLGHNAANAFDYSSRFDTTPGQAYRIDTGIQSVTLATGLGGSGSTLTKFGGGTLTLAGTSSYSGPTTVNEGEVVLQAPKSGTGNITLADVTALGLFEISGTQVTPGTLTLGTGGDTTLEFNNVTNSTTAPLAAGTLSAGGGTVNVNVNSGVFNTIGEAFPLFTWSSGSAPAVNLLSLSGAGGHLSTNASTIQLVIDTPPFIWTGANNNSWDTSTPNNWVWSGSAVTFTNFAIAALDDSTTVTNVTVNSLVQPASTTVTTTNAYTIASSGGNNIGGTNSLAKKGSGTLVLSGGANTYTGPTTINGGTVSVGVLANGGSPSDIGAASSSAANLVLNGGTLQYTGTGATIDHLFSLGTGGGTIDNEGSALVFNNTGTMGLVGSGPRGLTLGGTNEDANTLAVNIINSPGGATALTKSGAGKWILTGTNTYSGVTTISGGLLQIGAGGPSGSLGSGSVLNNGAIDFNRTGTNTVSGAISGNGPVTNDGSGTIILANNNTYSGGTMINAGTLQVGNGGATGSLYQNGPIHNNSLLIFNTTGTFNYTGTGLIDGSGNVIVRGSGGVIKAIANNAYTGWTTIDSGATFQPSEGNQGALQSSVVTNNGTLKLVRQDLGVFYYTNNIVGTGKLLKDVNNNNLNDVTLLGTNTYSGGTIIAGGSIVLGDGITPVSGTIAGNVVFTNSPTSQDVTRQLIFNRPDDFTFSGNITGPGGTLAGGAVPNAGQVIHNGTGTLTLTGNNTYLAGTTISNGTLQVGNGGASGAIGTGPVNNNTLLVFNRTGSLSVPGAISGPGSVSQVGSGTVTLSGANSYTGVTTNSNGTLVLNGTVGVGLLGGDVFLEGGALAPGGLGTVGTLTIGGNLHIDAGTVVATLNPLLVQSNSFVSLTNDVLLTAGTVTANPGTSLKLLISGAIPNVGDKYTLFSQPVSGGAGMTMVTPGFTVANNLAADGSVTVTATNPPPTITFTVSGRNLNLSWPSVWTGGVHLQAQTNSLARGLSSNWVTIPGTDLSNVYTTPLNKSSVSVFYRLVAP